MGDATTKPDAQADAADQRLRNLKLPQELDVLTSADKQLPTQAKVSVVEAKALGSETTLVALLAECQSKDAAARALLGDVDSALQQVEDQDAELLLQVPNAALDTLRSSYSLQQLRTRAGAAKGKLDTSTPITQSLSDRFNKSKAGCSRQSKFCSNDITKCI